MIRESCGDFRRLLWPWSYSLQKAQAAARNAGESEEMAASARSSPRSWKASYLSCSFTTVCHATTWCLRTLLVRFIWISLGRKPSEWGCFCLSCLSFCMFVFGVLCPLKSPLLFEKSTALTAVYLCALRTWGLLMRWDRVCWLLWSNIGC